VLGSVIETDEVVIAIRVIDLDDDRAVGTRTIVVDLADEDSAVALSFEEFHRGARKPPL